MTDQTEANDSSRIRLVMLGDPNAGKTSFVRRCVYGYFSKNYVSTLGNDFGTKVIELDGKTLRVELWDIPGQDRFINVSRSIMRTARGALLLYDLTDPLSRQLLLNWKTEFENQTIKVTGKKFPVLLLANKLDKVEGMSTGDKEAIKSFAATNGFIGCVFTSVKYNICIDEAIRSLLGVAIKSPPPSSTNRDDIVLLHEPVKNRKEERRSCWC